MTTTDAGGGNAPAAPTRPFQGLDGSWDFRFRHADGRADGDWRSITVPGVWQAQHEDLRLAYGCGRYRRTVFVPGEWAGCRLVLCVGAANYATDVVVDDHVVGRHEGGYLPFETDLTDWLVPGRPVSLELRVTLPPDTADTALPAFGEIPHGKQSWYGPLGGIWQSVRLEARAARHLRGLVLTTDGRSGECRARVHIAGDHTGLRGVRLALRAPDGSPAAEAEADIAGDEVIVNAPVDEPVRWSTDEPNLYDATVSLIDADGRVVDHLTRRTGFRTVETRNGCILVNGEPIVLRGALDQDYYPDTLCVPPSMAFLEDQLRKAKALGFNCLRCHIKVPDPRYLEVADRLGMLLWCELPNWGRWSDAAAGRGLDTLFGIIDRDDHHPSIIAWTIINEDWGTDLTCDPAQRQWLHEAWQAVKARDPGRLVVDNSPCEPNFHVRTDLADYHFYRGIPDNRGEWDAFVDDLAARRVALFSPHGDAVTTGDEPLVLSEFGNWGLPQLDGLRDAAGDEPWWFETGHDWSEGALYPHGIEQRFEHYHLRAVFGSLERFIDATQRRQFEALKHEIESLRASPAIAGYVVTELTDAHWEANGLMDMARRPRAFAQDFAAVNDETVLLVRPERLSVRVGETLAVSVSVSRAPALGRLDELRLEWALGDNGPAGCEVITTVSGALGATTVAGLSLRVPDGMPEGMSTLNVVLRDTRGAAVARSAIRIAVFPATNGEPLPSVWTPEPPLADWLAGLGAPSAATAGDAEVIVATRLDAGLTEAISRGARVLLLVDSDEAITAPPGVVPVYPRFPRAAAVRRTHTVWEGNWVSTFAWLRRAGPYAALPGDPMLDDVFGNLMPRYVLRGFRGDDFAASVRAGLLVGWLHHGVALIARRDLNRGSVLLCTLPVHDRGVRGDPLAVALARALLTDAATD